MRPFPGVFLEESPPLVESPRVRIVCPRCSAAIQLPAAMVNKATHCPKCGGEFASALGTGAAAPPPPYQTWAPFWQGMAMGGVAGAFLLVIGAVAVTAYCLLLR